VRYYKLVVVRNVLSVLGNLVACQKSDSELVIPHKGYVASSNDSGVGWTWKAQQWPRYGGALK